MKIHPPVDKPIPSTPTSGAPAATEAAKQATPAAPASAIPPKADASAKIAISSTATHLLSSSSSADFDADKVARISKAIDSNTFKINPEAIADKLISNAKELLTRS